MSRFTGVPDVPTDNLTTCDDDDLTNTDYAVFPDEDARLLLACGEEIPPTQECPSDDLPADAIAPVPLSDDVQKVLQRLARASTTLFELHNDLNRVAMRIKNERDVDYDDLQSRLKASREREVMLELALKTERAKFSNSMAELRRRDDIARIRSHVSTPRRDTAYRIPTYTFADK